VSIDYKAAGVNIEAGNEAVRRIKTLVQSTFSPAVLTPIGHFGAMYDLQPILESYRHPVLVQSMDGVGTKMMVAKMMQQFDTIGIDLVSATANDIIVMGAKPLTLLDYIANDKLDPHVIERIISGMVQACRENDIALVGGEMAEMPGTYCPGEYDLVGLVLGVVEKEKAILGHHIAVGDRVMAFPSSGLHTNGYSLARKLLFEVGGYSVNTILPGFSQSVGEVLLAPHVNYTQPIMALLQQGVPIHGMAHITGGGVLENIPRVLPAHCAVNIQKSACPVPLIFDELAGLGKLDEAALYRTFNMGIGFVMIVPLQALPLMEQVLQDYPAFPLYEIGEVVHGQKEVKFI
jgi:phosphoribosylformylglycinamidine cyclo-ligase